jgi:hypothetical protein
MNSIHLAGIKVVRWVLMSSVMVLPIPKCREFDLQSNY